MSNNLNILFLCLGISWVFSNDFSADLEFNSEENDGIYQKSVEFRLKGEIDSSLKELFQIKCCHLKSNYAIAEIYLNELRNYNISLDYFNEVVSYLNDNESEKKIADNKELYKKALFMTSYIYSNYLGMYSKGHEGYDLFSRQFPDDELLESVLYEIELLRLKEDEKNKLLLDNKDKK